MAAVPPKTLEWLNRVLTSNQEDPVQAYKDPNRTYNDVAHLLSQHPHFSPRTDVYTYESGASALLLQLSGTLPVTFRGAVYRFPITIWVSNWYPREPPMVYVTPTQDMLVRPGQHVTAEGKIYHHYLAHWADAWERSTLVDLVYILRDIFAKEPPVISKEAQSMRPPPSQQPAPPPPPAVPPLPPELVRQPSPAQPPPSQQQEPPPPALPPKPHEISGRDDPRQQPPPALPERYQKPPPLPPLPDDYHRAPQPPPQEERPGYSVGQAPPHQPAAPSSLRRIVSPTEISPHAPGPSNSAYSTDLRSPVSPIVEPADANWQTGYQPQTYGATHYAQQPPPQSYQHAPPPLQQPQALPIHPRHDATSMMLQHQQPPPQAPRPKRETQDLLTSPFDLELPEPATSGTPPPIPPNPEKDALMQNLSRTLTQNLRSNVEKTNSGLQPLHSQSKALYSAMSTLQSEITSLNNLHTTLQSNVSILQHSLHQADGVIADAKARMDSGSADPASSSTDPSAGNPPAGLPAIDEVLVAPTVVGKQVYDLVADERGIQRAIYALHSGLVKGRVGIDTWARHTRSLAREAFLKKALVRKAGKGMGLNTEDV